MAEWDDGVMRASEVAQYAYCAHAWWLGRVQGLSSENVGAMRKGSRSHQQHGRRVADTVWHGRLGYTLLLLALLTALVWLVQQIGA
jgi:hypothetical protein